MKYLHIVLSVLFLFYSYSQGKIVSIPPYVASHIEKGDKAIGPIKILKKRDNYIVCFIFPNRVIINLNDAEIVGKKELKQGEKIYLIQKESGRFIIIPVEEENEEDHDIYKEN
ncbi:MAG TPA: hypothetical protein DEP48_03745 [Persephonella sp.]|uniref:Uncharacterized protein n=1 Tax=Persephonella marina (strain DSM 14350 / EX-H1) TaxID=123214 RepID=C0QQJ1_PERMH|nr:MULTISPECIES: hypothetical protein [Persephonella]ACO03136.1 conserved hypothetical protein [Persephonella marina EX-H1]HCB69454.1 hypothetical protein [Persephonella sp.]